VGNQILITGGAGFIGSHLADRLLGLGHRVRILDNLSPQVHGEFARRPSYLDSEARGPGMGGPLAFAGSW
jgi:dTDP-L-rhamnose 4-epimerase